MSYETEIVHPAVAEWLSRHSYTFHHEVLIPGVGRADFIATDANGKIFIVECKANSQSIAPCIIQVESYCKAYGHDAQPILAFPSASIGDRAKKAYEKRHISVLGVECQTREEYESAQPPNARQKVLVSRQNIEVVLAVEELSWMRPDLMAYLKAVLWGMTRTPDNIDAGIDTYGGIVDRHLEHGGKFKDAPFTCELNTSALLQGRIQRDGDY